MLDKLKYIVYTVYYEFTNLRINKLVEEKKKMPKGTWLNMTNAYRESDIDARLNFTEANQKVKL